MTHRKTNTSIFVLDDQHDTCQLQLNDGLEVHCRNSHGQYSDQQPPAISTTTDNSVDDAESQSPQKMTNGLQRTTT